MPFMLMFWFLVFFFFFFFFSSVARVTFASIYIDHSLFTFVLV
jgi:hypothetical protein